METVTTGFQGVGVWTEEDEESHDYVVSDVESDKEEDHIFVAYWTLLKGMRCLMFIGVTLSLLGCGTDCGTTKIV